MYCVTLWRLEVWDQGMSSRADSLPASPSLWCWLAVLCVPWLTGRHVIHVSVSSCHPPSVTVSGLNFPFCKDTRQIAWGSSLPNDLILIWWFLKGLISKWNHILRFWVDVNLGETLPNLVHYSLVWFIIDEMGPCPISNSSSALTFLPWRLNKTWSLFLGLSSLG